ERLAGVQRRLAELLRCVRQQAILAELVPRQATAAVAVLLVVVAALREVVDDEPALLLLLRAGDGPRQLVALVARLAQDLLHVERAANVGDGREDARRRVFVLLVVIRAVLRLLFLGVGEEE